MTKDIVHDLRGLIDPASECLSEYDRINEFCQAAEKAIEEIGVLRTEKHGDAEIMANLERALAVMTARAEYAEALVKIAYGAGWIDRAQDIAKNDNVVPW
jgi:hypothetical protein